MPAGKAAGKGHSRRFALKCLAGASATLAAFPFAVQAEPAPAETEPAPVEAEPAPVEAEPAPAEAEPAPAAPDFDMEEPYHASLTLDPEPWEPEGIDAPEAKEE